MIRYLLAALLCAAPISSWASVQLEAGIGVAHADPRANGTWYQDGFPHKLALTQPVAEVGIRIGFNAQTSLSLDAVRLGTYTSDSLDTPADGNYSGNAVRPCVGPCLPLAHYMGRGSIEGLQALFSRTTAGLWRLGWEFGPFVYRTTWRLDVPNWYAATPSESGYVIGPITPIHTDESRWSLGYVAGLRLEHGRWFVALRVYADGQGFRDHVGAWPPIWRRHFVGLVGWAF